MKKFAIVLLITLPVFLCPSPSFAAKRALLVGIAEYKSLSLKFQGGKLTNLRGPVNDVTAVKEALISYYGFSEKDIRVLTNREATYQKIAEVFNEWLVEGTKKDDLVVFYFSGHGSRVKDVNGDEEDRLDEVLLPYDMVPDGGYNILIDDELGSWLSRLNGREVVAIADSCYSGGVARGIRGQTVSTLEETPGRHSRFIPITNYRPSPIALSTPKGPDVPGSVVFMAASREIESAQETNQPGRFYGAFTFGLYDGMKSLKTVSYKELFEHAKKVVTDRFQLPQEPQIMARGDMLVKDAFGLPDRKQRPPDHGNTAPTAPPEIRGEKVLVKIEFLHESLSKALKELPYVEVTEEVLFDSLIRGERKKDGKYYVRLLNRIGDVVKIQPSTDMEALVKAMAPHLEYAYMVKQLARIHHPSPPFRVKVWVTDEERRDFRIGEKVVFNFYSERDCYLLMLNLDSEGNFHIIFPNQFYDDNRIRGGKEGRIKIPDKKMGGKFELEFGEPTGEEMVKVIATIEPLKLEDLGLKEFKQLFDPTTGRTSVPEKKRAILVKEVVKNLSSRNFVWSEDTIIIRSHK